MLAGVKLIDKAAAERALKQEERARKEEKKQLKKVRLRIWQSGGMRTSCRMQMSTWSNHLSCDKKLASAGEESSAEAEAQAG
jgi:hypothetical protein